MKEEIKKHIQIVKEHTGSPTFCILPWIHMATRPNGDVRLCCTANASGAGHNDIKDAGLIKKDGVALNLRIHSVSEVWNSDHMKETRLQMLQGVKPSSCLKCFQEEQTGIVSKRLWELEVWKKRIDISEIVSKTDKDGSLPVNIPYFDLRLGNTCQLKCVMCSPHDSSSWIKDWRLQYPKYKTIELKQDQNWEREYNYNWYQNNNFLSTMKEQAQYIKELYFAGGEPLLIPEHYKILEFMVDSGNAKNCILRYNSNGLELPEKLFELWKYFKQVKFNFSIDAVGDKNDYIRYPSEWSRIVKNLYRLDNTPDNIVVNIACAVQLLNVLYITDLVEWKEQQEFKKINLPPYGAGLIGTHLVYLPSYLNIKVLPKEVKLQVEDRINRFCNQRANDREFVSNPYGMQRWKGLIQYMNSEDWSNKLSIFKDYITVTDQTRDTNFKKTFPELAVL
jgi:MoaA/NifB/PqqE/SkfB family radical SAM enzyme